MSAVTVWSKPRCVQCIAVYRALDKGGVEYETKNLPDFPEVLEQFIADGHMGAPVVVAEGVDPFFGFNPDALAEVVARHGVVEQ